MFFAVFLSVLLLEVSGDLQLPESSPEVNLEDPVVHQDVVYYHTLQPCYDLYHKHRRQRRDVEDTLAANIPQVEHNRHVVSPQEFHQQQPGVASPLTVGVYQPRHFDEATIERYLDEICPTALEAFVKRYMKGVNGISRSIRNQYRQALYVSLKKIIRSFD